MGVSRGKIEDVYRLSPVHQGLLFHSLYAPESGQYVVQLVYQVAGALDLGAFAEAWRRTCRRHPALRTSFHWRELDKPVQVVHGEVEVPVVHGRCPDPAAAARTLAAYLAADRRRGFDLSRPPLLRLWVQETADRLYQVVWSYHHLLLDGWSAPLVLRDLFAFYQAEITGGPAALPAVRPYRDFIAWLEARDRSADETFWRRMLIGFVTPTPLPAARPEAAPAMPAATFDAGGGVGGEAGHRELVVTGATADGLGALARRHGLTVSLLFQAAWGLLLGRTGGAADVVFGITTAGRPPSLAGSGEMVGLFISTLPLRLEVRHDAALDEWLQEVKQRFLAVVEHEHSSLQEVQGWSALPRGRALFDSLLVYENLPLPALAMAPAGAMGGGGPGGEHGGIELRDARLLVTTNYALFIAVRPGGRLLVDASYDRRRFDSAAIARTLGQLAALLGAFVAASPRRRLDALPLLTAAERHQLLQEWNDTAEPWAREACLHELVASQARRTPEAVAVSHSEVQLTYRQLAARAAAVAWRLRRLGIGTETVVAVCVERTIELPAVLLGILAAGGAYLPLDPAYPRPRLAAMLDDSGAAVLVTSAELLASLPVPAGVATLLLAETAQPPTSMAETAATDDMAAAGPAYPEGLAYLLYTSGSTGRPKGVQVTHRAAVNFLLGMQQRLRLGAGDALLAVTTLSFDIAMLELFLPLAVGARVVLAGSADARDGRRLTALLAAVPVTAMQATPATWQMLLDAEWAGSRGLLLLCGGEALLAPLASAMRARGRALWNLYGPTETTVWSAAHRVEEAAGVVAMGRPLANTEIHLLDRSLAPVPVGVVGEVHIGGAGLSRGYRRLPELTARQFAPDPWSVRPGGRLYATGDLARRLPAGELEFIGRADAQLKVRGFRIEAGEVETALSAHAAVSRAAVTFWRGRPPAGGGRLVAYVVRAPAAAAATPAALAGELQQHARRLLPDYMVPDLVVELDRLPLTPNGKVDRRALPEPDIVVPARSGGTAPRTPVEELVAAIWSALLGVERISVEDSFFALGGQSLLATQLLSRLRRTCGVELPLREVFAAENLAALAAAVERARAGFPPAPPIVALPRGPRLPLSFAQERLWLLEQLEPGTAAYNLSLPFGIRGALSPAVLRASLDEVVRRHEALRTSFAVEEGQPLQRIAVTASAPLSVVDLAELPAARRREEALALAAAAARRPFDLATAPLLRALLLRLGREEHLLVLAMHHIVADGWSIQVLMRDLKALYGALRRGLPSPLPELPIQYGDFACWQRAWLRGEVLERQLRYWRGQLAGAPAGIELPADRPRMAMQSYRGAHLYRVVPSATLGRLRERCRHQGATLFMTLLAAFAALVERYTASADVVVGTPIANRTRVEVEDLVGLFTNTLVLRVGLAGDPPVGQLLGRVREVCLGAYAHQDLPFEQLVAALQPERDLSRQPLFQLFLELHNQAGQAAGHSAAWRSGQGDRPPAAVEPGRPPAPAAGELRIEELAIDSGTAKFDLSLAAVEAASGLALTWEIATDLFDRATALRLGRHFQALLAGLAGESLELPLSGLPLLAPAEVHQLLVDWNDTAAPPAPDSPGPGPAAATLHDLFTSQAARSPDAAAIARDQETVTYGELARRAGGMAGRLAAHGMGPGSIVGLLAGRCPEMVAAMLGILRAGGAYLPLDPGYPAERLAWMVEDAGAAAVVGEAGLRSLLPAGVTFLDLHAGRPSLGAAAPGAAAGAGPFDLAYVLYTSGSTGRPKGVVMPHRAIVSLVGWQISESARTDPRPPEAAAPRTLQFAALSFDVSCQEVFATLGSGGTLVLVSEETRRDPPALLAAISAQAVERLFLPFVALQQLAEAAAEREAPALALREVITAGEQLRATAAVREMFRRLPGCRLYNQYGPTESHVASAHALPGDPGRWPALPPIGRGVANLRLHVLDAAGRPAPIGVAGELHLGGRGGAGLARGYLGRPDLTAERFVPDPFASRFAPGDRLYRTGDLARTRPGGEVEFLGRRDQQVKLRGFRIELGEVEAALAAHPAVREAAVALRNAAAGGDSGGASLVAYVVLHPGTRAAPGELARFIARTLPEPMVPALWVELDVLPLTPSGKLDRRALPAPEPRRGTAAAAAARGPVAEVLAAIWEDLLAVRGVGLEDSFFALGGHSLLATQMLSRLRRAFDVELPLREVFAAPTLGALAAAVELARAEPTVTAPPIVARRRGARLPLSFAQQRLWFLEQLEPGKASYNVTLAFRVGGALAVPLLRASLGEVVRRHEALRTGFDVEAGQPVQRIAAAGLPSLPVVDLRRLPAARQHAAKGERIRGAARRLFDLAAPPLLRALLVRVAAAEHVLVLSMHHIVSDGWSVQVLMRELQALYGTYAGGLPSPLPELPIQYADFACWQREWLRGAVLTGQLRYWRERLAGAPAVLELPADRPRPVVQSYHGAHLLRAVPEAVAARLRANARRQGVTLFMTLLAGFAALVERYTGRSDLVFGTPIANRNRVETEDLIGCFANTLVLRVLLAGDPSVTELLARVREVCLGAYAHQDLPFERLVDELQPERDLSRHPLFQILFELHNQGAAVAARSAREAPAGGPAGSAPARLLVEQLAVEDGTAKFDLTLSAIEGVVGGLALIWEYATDLFDRVTLLRIDAHFQELLGGLAAEPLATTLSGLRLLAPAERHQLLVEWNDTAAPPPVTASVPALFAAQVERTPEAVAVACGGDTITYRELSCRLGRLARRLSERGVGPNVLVGIYMARGAEVVEALLGVLAAGGIYLPLDPVNPRARLEGIVAGSGVRLAVTRRGAGEDLPALAMEEIDCGGPPHSTDPPDSTVGLPAVAGGGEDGELAYVIYTSGSTGVPKGAMVTRRGMLNHLLAKIEELRLGPGDRLAQTAALSFDVSVWQLLAPLLVGATVHVVRDEEVQEPERLLTVLARGSVTVLEVVPSLLAALLAGRRRHPGLAALRTLIATGEALPATLASKWLRDYPRVPLVNAYGPTECSDDVSHRYLAAGDALAAAEAAGAGAAVAIGRPLRNTRLYVLARDLAPLPLGAVGELWVGGAGVGRGYLRAPDRTAERFVPDPHGGGAGARLYRTGDLVRLRPGGEIEFLGRIDQQVKVRGFRIELGEVEAALAAHPAVGEVAVAALSDSRGERFLAAYVVPAGEPPPAVGELRGFLRERLPASMIPSAFVRLAALPHTTSGKVDRGALPAPSGPSASLATEAARGGAGAASATGAGERGAAESLVAGIWRELLGVEQVAAGDDFFELGGHSLLAVEMLARLRDATGVGLSLRRLFERPTVAGLAGALEQRRLDGDAVAFLPALPRIEPNPARRGEPFPLTELQQAYWIGGGDAYELGQMSPHSYVELELRPLDVEGLDRAWRRLIERHDALRLVLTGDGCQRVLPEAPPYEIPVVDLRGSPPEAAAERLAEIRRRMSEQGPDLAGWPLFELRASLLDGGWVRLHVSVSLLVCDARSAGLLVGQLRELYLVETRPETAPAAARAAETAPPRLSLRDCVVAINALPGSLAWQRSLAYWEQRLAALPPGPELPLAQAPARLARPAFTLHRARLPHAGWNGLRRQAARARCTPTAVLAAAYAEVLAAWSRHPRFTLDLLYFNRPPLHPEIGEVIGNLSSTLLLEVDVAAGCFEQRAQRLQAQLWRDMDHSLVSGVRVLRELTRRGGGSRFAAPVVFASMLNLNAPPAAGPPAAPPAPLDDSVEAAARHVFSSLQTPQVWIDGQVEEIGGELQLSWYVVEELFPAGLAEQMFSAFRLLVERLAGDEAAWLDAARVLTPASQLAVRRQVNATAAPLVDGPLHGPLLAAAARRPQAVALIAGGGDRRADGESLTYGELVARSARLAERLRAERLAPEALVAVVAEKGWEQLVAVVAVIEAGGAYLPIDPSLPPARIHALLSIGGSRVALAPARLIPDLDWPAAVRPLAIDRGGAACPAGESATAGAVPPPFAAEQAARRRLAYVLFTSGSTGEPKGVMIEHQAALNTITDVNRRFAVGPRDRVLSLSALGFDLSVYDVFGLLAAGGAVVVPAADQLREPAAWAALLADERVTIWNSVPALMEMLVDHLEAHGAALPDSLRLVLLSGDWIPVHLPDRIQALRPGVEVISLGGATEAAIWSVLYPIGKVQREWTSIPYGLPMANQAWEVVDSRGLPRPAWVAGDLCIAGAGVARGYLRDAGATAACFVPHAGGPGVTPGERLYRTGDVGRYLPDGTLEILGREDLQVKIQGYRIELGEIETALAAHPRVAACAVTAAGPRGGGRRLLAHVVLAGAAAGKEPASGASEADGGDGGSGAALAAELAAFLSARLPRYMVPASFVALSALPLTRNGKVDRAALAAAAAAATVVEETAAAGPRDELERQLAGIWEEVLGAAAVPVRANFFQLGGDSLAAVRLMARIEQRLGCQLALGVLFENPTVERLAALLRDRAAPLPARPLVGLRPQGSKRPFFCVHPVSGSVLCYADLVRHLDAERPVYGLQAPEDPPLATVEDMAACYREALRAAQPAGPYLLGGWSMGGVVAFEMARQLRLEGERVDAVVLIDPPAPAVAGGGAGRGGAAGGSGGADLPGASPGDGSEEALAAVDLLAWFGSDLGGLAGHRLEISRSRLAALPADERLAWLHQQAAAVGALPAELTLPRLRRLFASFARHACALARYRPPHDAGSLACFWAADGAAWQQRGQAWKALMDGEVDDVVLPGDHFSLLQPPRVGELGSRLGALLDRADRWREVACFLAGRAARVLGLGAGGAALPPRKPLVALGLDSLSAAELGFEIETHCGIQVPLADLLAGDSLEDLTSRVVAVLDAVASRLPAGAMPGVATTGDDGGPAARRLAPGGEDGAGSGGDPAAAGAEALSYGQEAIWYLHRLAPEAAAYTLAGAARVHGALDVGALRRAFALLAARHPALRTTFPSSAGRPVALTSGTPALALCCEEVADGWHPARLAARLGEEVRRPFDLEQGPLWRVHLLRLAPESSLLLLTVHHIVADFQSLAILARELDALYREATGGPPARLPALTADPGDLARGQRRSVTGAEEERLLDFWRRHLAGCPRRLDLPTDRPRPPFQGFAGGARSLRLDRGQAAAVRALAATASTTPFTVLLAALQVLLHRYSHERRIVVGVPASCREGSLEGVVGYLVNPLALAGDLGGDPPFGELLDRVRCALLAALAHRAYPFARLVERLGGEPDLSASPLFQAMLVWHRDPLPGDGLAAFALGEPGATLPLGEAELESLALAPSGAPLDLTLAAAELQGSVVLRLTYSACVFDGTTAQRMLQHLARLLGAATAEPARRISDLPLLGAAEAQCLREWSSGGAAPRTDGCLHRLVSTRAALTPDAIALVHFAEPPQRWSYGHLARRASQLAHHLIAAGVEPEDRVGLLLERGPELVAAVLAVLAAGAAYVPLDPAYPAAWRQSVLDQAGVKTVLVMGGGRPAAGEAPGTTGGATAGRVAWIDLGGEHAAIGSRSLAGPNRRVLPEQLAYVLYTSGSTGRPKGVAVTHRSAAALVAWAAEAFTPAELSGVLASTSLCFDLSVFELFAPLACGGTVVLAEDALQLPRLAAAAEVRLLNTVPSAVAELARQGGIPAAVGTVNLAGEPLRRRLVDRLYRLPGVRRVINLYGPTEDTTYSTFAVVERLGEREPAIGRPVPGSTAHVLDGALRPVPVGVAGLLHLGGAGLARCYLGRPDATAAAFIPDPFAAAPGERLYATGDLARWLPGGELQFLGRRDEQVKLRGYRIELGHLEAAAVGHPGVAEAAAALRGSPRDGTQGELLVLYVVPAADSLGAEELRAHLAAELPGYMVPGQIVLVSSLPRTPSGKIDRRALPLAVPRPEAAVRVAPRTPVEATVAEIWKSVLEAGEVGIFDRFFELGGHSLHATQVASRLSAAFGLAGITPRLLFEQPTVAEQALLVTEMQAATLDGEEIERLFAELEADGETAAVPRGVEED